MLRKCIPIRCWSYQPRRGYASFLKAVAFLQLVGTHEAIGIETLGREDTGLITEDSPADQTKGHPDNPTMIARLWRTLGLDRAIIFTVLARGWSSAAGLLTLVLIARFLSSAEQGYYYTFGSLVALQVIFELGFSFVILQMASHERAHLSLTADHKFHGDPVAHARLASVLQKSVRWYSIAALLLFCFLVPAGIHFFSAHAQPGHPVAWRIPWLVDALAASLAFQIDPMFSFLEGCGYVPQVAHTRFWQALAGSLLAWSALILHFGLFAPAMMIVGQVLVGVVFLSSRRVLLLGLLRQDSHPYRIRWRSEVWPFQWRIAVSYLSGYFIFQLFIPVLFAFRGPAAAGQMGMSLSITNALLSVSISWVSTKAAPFGAMIARKEFAKLDHIFFRVLAQSTAVSALGSLTLWCAVVYINARNLPFAHRLLAPLPMGILLVSMMVNHVVFAEALYLRAHKQEKFLPLSVIGACLIMVSTFLLGRQFGAVGMVGGYCILNLVIGLGFGTYVFFKYRRIWHAA